MPALRASEWPKLYEATARRSTSFSILCERGHFQKTFIHSDSKSNREALSLIGTGLTAHQLFANSPERTEILPAKPNGLPGLSNECAAKLRLRARLSVLPLCRIMISEPVNP